MTRTWEAFSIFFHSVDGFGRLQKRVYDTFLMFRSALAGRGCIFMTLLRQTHVGSPANGSLPRTVRDRGVVPGVALDADRGNARGVDWSEASRRLLGGLSICELVELRSCHWPLRIG